nr:MAG TPA: hypothetical protein [Caudoviricetes sp.]
MTEPFRLKRMRISPFFQNSRCPQGTPFFSGTDGSAFLWSDYSTARRERPATGWARGGNPVGKGKIGNSRENNKKPLDINFTLGSMIEGTAAGRTVLLAVGTARVESQNKFRRRKVRNRWKRQRFTLRRRLRRKR